MQIQITQSIFTRPTATNTALNKKKNKKQPNTAKKLKTSPSMTNFNIEEDFIPLKAVIEKASPPFILNYDQ